MVASEGVAAYIEYVWDSGAQERETEMRVAAAHVIMVVRVTQQSLTSKVF